MELKNTFLQDVRKLQAKGLRNDEIARNLNVPVQVLNFLGTALQSDQNIQSMLLDITRLREGGMRLENIATTLGMSYSRVKIICETNNIQIKWYCRECVQCKKEFIIEMDRENVRKLQARRLCSDNCAKKRKSIQCAKHKKKRRMKKL